MTGTRSLNKQTTSKCRRKLNLILSIKVIHFKDLNYHNHSHHPRTMKSSQRSNHHHQYYSHVQIIVVLSTLTVTTVFLPTVSAMTPCGPCERSQCPPLPTSCADGTGLVLDMCECCAMCGRARGQSCSSVQPCDRGLICDFDNICHGKKHQ